jgi:hypothetical protein
MMGLNKTITPEGSGVVLIIISGTIFNAGGIGDGATVRLYTGTGTPPTNGAAVTGTARSGQQKFISSTTAEKVPFSVQALVSSLTLATAYWIDLALTATTGGTATVTDLSVTATEVLHS